MDDAHAVAEQGAAAGLGGRIDRDHPDALAALAPGRDQGRAEGGFSDAGRAGDTDHVGLRGAPGLVEQGQGPGTVTVAFEVDKRGRQGPLATATERGEGHSVLSEPPKAAWAAASRAIGTR